MDVTTLACLDDVRPRLRTAVLGGEARAFGHCRGHGSSYHPCFYGAVGNHFAPNAKAHRAIGFGPLDRDWLSISANEPIVKPRRGADRQGGCHSANHCIDKLVGCVRTYAQAAPAEVESDDLSN